MKNILITLCLAIYLSGCGMTIGSKYEFNNELSEWFDEGFILGVKCMAKTNNSEQCMEILKIAKEKINDSKN